MSKRLTEIYEEAKEAEFQAKLAAINEAWGEDQDRLETLDLAVDFIKEASEGDSPILATLDAADTLTLAANVVEYYFDKEAELVEEDDDEIVEELGKLAYDVLAEALEAQGSDMDPEEFVEKCASTDEEQEELGRWMAQEVYARLQSDTE